MDSSSILCCSAEEVPVHCNAISRRCGIDVGLGDALEGASQRTPGAESGACGSRGRPAKGASSTGRGEVIEAGRVPACGLLDAKRRRTRG
jgi:hypothetical protein